MYGYPVRTIREQQLLVVHKYRCATSRERELGCQRRLPVRRQLLLHDGLEVILGIWENLRVHFDLVHPSSVPHCFRLVETVYSQPHTNII